MAFGRTPHGVNDNGAKPATGYGVGANSNTPVPKKRGLGKWGVISLLAAAGATALALLLNADKEPPPAPPRPLVDLPNTGKDTTLPGIGANARALSLETYPWGQLEIQEVGTRRGAVALYNRAAAYPIPPVPGDMPVYGYVPAYANEVGALRAYKLSHVTLGHATWLMNEQQLNIQKFPQIKNDVIDILTRNRDAKILECRYVSKDPAHTALTRYFWYQATPDGADTAHLSSVDDNHPFLSVRTPQSRCPVALPR